MSQRVHSLVSYARLGRRSEPRFPSCGKSFLAAGCALVAILVVSVAPAVGCDLDANSTLDGNEGRMPTDARKACVDNGKYWNQFRGPNGDGKTLATDLPVEFGERQHVRWKTPIHDKGWSSPVVWGNQIWLTTALDDGKELKLNTHASPTPIIEDGRVYVHYGTYGTACLDTKSGKKLWERRDLNCDHRVRPASSPIIDGDSLFPARNSGAFVIRAGAGTWHAVRFTNTISSISLRAWPNDCWPSDPREPATSPIRTSPGALAGVRPRFHHH